MTGTQPLSPQSGAQARVLRIEEILQTVQAHQGASASHAYAYQAATNTRIAVVESTIRDREEAIRNTFEQMAAQRAAEMAALVADARTEFDNQRQQLQSISSAFQLEFIKSQQQIDQRSSSKDAGKFEKSFLPRKELKPSK